MENDLSLVPYEELLKELDNRFEHWVFSGAKNINSSGGIKSMTVRRWGGNSMICSGLASMMSVAVYDESMENDEGTQGTEI